MDSSIILKQLTNTMTPTATTEQQPQPNESVQPPAATAAPVVVTGGISPNGVAHRDPIRIVICCDGTWQ